MFYRPSHSVAADVIPFYCNNAFRLFYLRDFRDIENHGEGTPWYLLSTCDFVQFKEHGEVLKRGSKEEQDLYVFTGSAYEKNGKTYLFYTGHNPHFIEQGKHQEAVMLAVSNDFETWEKEADFKLLPTSTFEAHDFRDPFVFYNEETEEYNMLLAARLTAGPDRRRGCTAVAVSKDLISWDVQDKPFYSPGLYYTHECPDLFKMGEWWYLVFSEFTDKCETRYRMAKTLEGPWLTPDHDTFDNRNFYAAKTVSDGKERYVIGWNPTNQKDQDFEETMWGGNIIVHKIVQREDGTLWVDCPDTIRKAYQTPVSLQERLTAGWGEMQVQGWKLGRPDGYSNLDFGFLPKECRISFTVTFLEDTQYFYLYLHSDREQEKAYYIGLEPGMSRMTFDRWPRKRQDHPFMLELERKAVMTTGEAYEVEVIADHSVLEVYFDHKVAMSARMNELTDGTFGAAVSFGKVMIRDLCCQIL